MIKFKCTNCDEELEAPESMLGQALSCPSCGASEIVAKPEKSSSLTSVPPSGQTGTWEASTQIRTFDAVHHKQEFKRPLEPGKPFATRVRTFHMRLSTNTIALLDDQVNEWLDENPEVLVKFAETTVGTVEGKKTEPHLIVTVWY